MKLWQKRKKNRNAPAGNRTRDPSKCGWCSTKQSTSPASLFEILSALPPLHNIGIIRCPQLTNLLRSGEAGYLSPFPLPLTFVCAKKRILCIYPMTCFQQTFFFSCMESLPFKMRCIIKRPLPWHNQWLAFFAPGAEFSLSSATKSKRSCCFDPKFIVKTVAKSFNENLWVRTIARGHHLRNIDLTCRSEDKMCAHTDIRQCTTELPETGRFRGTLLKRQPIYDDNFFFDRVAVA